MTTIKALMACVAVGTVLGASAPVAASKPLPQKPSVKEEVQKLVKVEKEEIKETKIEILKKEEIKETKIKETKVKVPKRDERPTEPIPEPSSALVFGAGLFAAGLAGRRRRQG